MEEEGSEAKTKQPATCRWETALVGDFTLTKKDSLMGTWSSASGRMRGRKLFHRKEGINTKFQDVWRIHHTSNTMIQRWTSVGRLLKKGIDEEIRGSCELWQEPGEVVASRARGEQDTYDRRSRNCRPYHVGPFEMIPSRKLCLWSDYPFLLLFSFFVTGSNVCFIIIVTLHNYINIVIYPSLS